MYVRMYMYIYIYIYVCVFALHARRCSAQLHQHASGPDTYGRAWRAS